MQVKPIDTRLSVGPQIAPEDIAELAARGFRSVVCNRPDGEGPDQPSFAEIETAAQAAGLEARHIPVTGQPSPEQAERFGEALRELPGPVFAYCRSGMRAATLWALSAAGSRPVAEILAAAKSAGYDLSGVARRLVNGGRIPSESVDASHEVVIVGGGAAGIAAAASLKARRPDLDIAIIEPADVHYYQPGWTLVGAGVFEAGATAHTMASVIPRGVRWIKAAVAAFEPEKNAIVLDGCRVVTYRRLIVAPGLKLDWNGVEGLAETLGRHGVTSNYRYDLAPYTWQLVQDMRKGHAIFTQPPMPIKCAGAPQKAMYLSADEWRRRGVLGDIAIDFCNAGAVLFGVPAYVPALERYVERYGIRKCFHHRLVAIDGPARKAWFEVARPETPVERVEMEFDMIHVVPPQTAPDFVRVSPLADDKGWVEVDPRTLRHRRYANIWSLGDAANAPNAKTAAAARKQAPVVATNVLADIDGRPAEAAYDGYGSCPLTVEKGRIVLAEFGYDGKLLPTFPSWMIDGTKPSRMAWLLKERILPPIYWQAMLKGREWGAKPSPLPAAAD
jgi:sulfide:quinone oxidoreductase